MKSTSQFLSRLIELLSNAPANESIKKLLNPILRMLDFLSRNRFFFTRFSLLAFGSAVLDECLLKAELNADNSTIGKTFSIEQGILLRP